MSTSTSHHGNFVHVILEMVEDGQRLEFDVGPGTERKKIRFEIGHVQGYGELYVERFVPEKEGDELDLRVKLIVPSGAGDRPSSVGPTLVGTYNHQQIIAKAASSTDTLAVTEFEVTDVVESLPEENSFSVAELEPILVPDPDPSEMFIAKQFTTPTSGEEADLTKLSQERSGPKVMAFSEPSLDEVAALTNTTPPKVGEERKLEESNRKKLAGKR